MMMMVSIAFAIIIGVALQEYKEYNKSTTLTSLV
jgi:ABC-type phosphate transport system permease subunit